MTDSAAGDVENITDSPEDKPEPWFRALAGTMTDEEVDEFIRHIYAEREKDKGRPPPTFD
jgi:hypothetical protein